MKPDIHREVMERLQAYDFKDRSGWLRQGRCPACNKKELYTNAEHPWVLRCGRLNNCGYEGHVKDLFPEIFDHWSTRYAEEAKTNPNAAADAYLAHARGFDISKLKGCYTQETYHDREKGITSATVRFPVARSYWERLIDQPSRFGKKKARFQYGGSYVGEWWTPPGFDIAKVAELWLVEGIFDAIALWSVGIHAAALLSCNNYPSVSLRAVADARPNNLPHLVWALDGDSAGRSFIRKFVERAQDDGWTCKAAIIPQDGRIKRDWNDLYLLDRNTEDPGKHRLSAEGRKLYLHHGAVLLARSATEKALLLYEHDNSRTEFDFEFGKRLYWFRMDIDAYQKAMDRIGNEAKEQLASDELRALALREAGGTRCDSQPVRVIFVSPSASARSAGISHMGAPQFFPAKSNSSHLASRSSDGRWNTSGDIRSNARVTSSPRYAYILRSSSPKAAGSVMAAKCWVFGVMTAPRSACVGSPLALLRAIAYRNTSPTKPRSRRAVSGARASTRSRMARMSAAVMPAIARRPIHGKTSFSSLATTSST